MTLTVREYKYSMYNSYSSLKSHSYHKSHHLIHYSALYSQCLLSLPLITYYFSNSFTSLVLWHLSVLTVVSIPLSCSQSSLDLHSPLVKLKIKWAENKQLWSAVVPRTVMFMWWLYESRTPGLLVLLLFFGDLNRLMQICISLGHAKNACTRSRRLVS